MPVRALASLVAALWPVLPLVLLVPAPAAGLDRGSPFYRAAPYVPPAAATFSAPAETRGFRPVGVEAPPVPPGGRLPNQRTGPMRDHVVRDICVGC